MKLAIAALLAGSAAAFNVKEVRFSSRIARFVRLIARDNWRTHGIGVRGACPSRAQLDVGILSEKMRILGPRPCARTYLDEQVSRKVAPIR